MDTACGDLYNSSCMFKVQRDRRNSLFMEGLKSEAFDLNQMREVERNKTAENPNVRRLVDTKVICAELDKCKREEIANDQRLKQLHHNVEEVRELIGKLQAAATTKELTEQLVELERQHKEAECRRREDIAKFADELKSYQQSERDRELEEIRKKLEYGRVLKEQMLEVKKRKEQEYEAVLQDKEKRIEQQKKDEEMQKAEQKQMLWLKKIKKLEFEDYICKHRKFKQQLREKEKAELQDTDDVLQEMETRQRAIDLAAEQVRKHRTLVSEQIGSELLILNTRKQREEESLSLLHIEERMHELDKLHKQKVENEVKAKYLARIESEKYLKNIIHYKRICRDREAAKHKAERERIEAEHIKKAELENESRRQKQLQSAREMHSMLEYQRQRRAFERAESLKDDKLLRSMELKRQEEIDGERLRLLRKQPELLPYLARHALRTHEYEMMALHRDEGHTECST